MNTSRHRPSPKQFSLECLEARVLPSAVAITFDPTGTLIKSIGTIDGTKYIQVSGGVGGGSLLGVPTGGGHGPASVRVFATDLNHDGIVETNEVTGIALSNKAKVIIFGDVNGDIVTNLTGKGDLSGDAADGSVLLAAGVAQITVHGSVNGNIIVGGGLSNVKIDGSVNEIMIGTAASGMSFQFHGPDAAGVTIAPFTVDSSSHGGDVTRASIGTSITGIFGSDGSVGHRGTEITNVTILNDDSALIVQAGNGGISPDGRAGSGGSLINITVQSNADVSLITGNGGDSTATSGTGGAGGDITNVRITTAGSITLAAGNGGADSNSRGHGSDGGSIRTATVTGANMTLVAGSGGAGTLLGGDGGGIQSVHGSLGGEANLKAGDGGLSATAGGVGGDVDVVFFAPSSESAFIRSIVAGNGGNGDALNGDGGSIMNVRFSGDIGNLNEIYGVDSMGGLFAGTAGGSAFGAPGLNGSVTKVSAGRIAAIVAGTADAPEAAAVIGGIHASAIGANFDTSVEGGVEPGFDFIVNVIPYDGRYDLGEIPIDGPVIGAKIGSLSATPLFLFQTNDGKEVGALDPHLGA